MQKKLKKKKRKEEKQMGGNKEMCGSDENDLHITSSSGLLEGSFADFNNKKTTTTMMQASLSADSSTSDSKTAASSTRDQRMASLEDVIKTKEAALESLLKKIEDMADERRELRKLPESRHNDRLRKELRNDIADLRKNKDRLAGAIDVLKAKLNDPKYQNEPVTTVTAEGINHYNCYYNCYYYYCYYNYNYYCY